MIYFGGDCALGAYFACKYALQAFVVIIATATALAGNAVRVCVCVKAHIGAATQGALDEQMRLVCFAAKRLALIESSPGAGNMMAAVGSVAFYPKERQLMLARYIYVQ